MDGMVHILCGKAAPMPPSFPSVAVRWVDEPWQVTTDISSLTKQIHTHIWSHMFLCQWRSMLTKAIILSCFYFLGIFFSKAKTPQDSTRKSHQHPPFFAVWIFSTQSAFRQLSTLFDRWKRRFLSLGKRQALETNGQFRWMRCGNCGWSLIAGASWSLEVT